MTVYDNFTDFLNKNPDAKDKLYMATTKARQVYTDIKYEEDAYLMFGKESAGIPEELYLKMSKSASVFQCWKRSAL